MNRGWSILSWLTLEQSFNSQEPISGETLLLADKGSKEVMEEVVASSRRLYGKEYIEPPVVIKPKEIPQQRKTRATNKKKNLVKR